MQRALTILVHGASKAGKSAISVTGPAPRLYMDVESAARFLAIKPVEWDPAKAAPPVPDGTWDTAVVATRDWGTVERAYQWLASGQHPFKSLVIDSVSELQQRYIETQSGRQQPTMQQWGSTFRVVSGLIRDIRDLTQHPTKPLECVVMTAMTRQIDGMWKPWVQGQLQTVLPYLLDVVAYLWVEQQAIENFDGTTSTREVRKILTRRTSQFEAGERVDGKIPIVVEITPRAPGSPGHDIDGLIDMVFPPETTAPTATPTSTATATTETTETETTTS